MDGFSKTALGRRQYQFSRVPASATSLDPANAVTSGTPSESTPAAIGTTTKRSIATGEKAGIGIGAAGFVVLLAIVIWIFFLRSRNKLADAETGNKKSRVKLGFWGRNKKTEKRERPIISEPKPIHSPSTIKSSPREASISPVPSPPESPPRSPPPIRPKSSKRPPSLPIMPYLPLPDSEPCTPKTPEVPEKSARRCSLLLEESHQSQSSPDITQSTPPQQTMALFPDVSDSPADLSLHPLPLFSPAPDLLRRISEDSKERAENRTPEVPAKAAARLSVVSSTVTIAGSANTADELEIAALRAENEQLRRETMMLRERCGEN